MNFLRQLAFAIEDDVFIKFIFDHIRNFALCALVFAAADWKFNQATNIGSIGAEVMAVGFNIVGAFLFFANLSHGLSKLKKIELPWWLRVFLLFTYVPLTLLIVSIAFRT